MIVAVFPEVRVVDCDQQSLSWQLTSQPSQRAGRVILDSPADLLAYTMQSSYEVGSIELGIWTPTYPPYLTDVERGHLPRRQDYQQIRAAMRRRQLLRMSRYAL